ncbi:hypothetical protein JTE90_004298 [Oedothorax gibbosus]|uniref:Uncharacterized protein n=1 Tax=Oedothorax gibbosus TaxID=931172 RepID=A0AAV6VMS4_9ARAC|nr:hypothetical protein JTE90_004298 [Oedothorax gibbosus]
MTLEDRDKLSETPPHKKFTRSTSITETPNPFLLISPLNTGDLKSSKLHSRKRARTHSYSKPKNKRQRHFRNTHSVKIYACISVENDTSSPRKSAFELRQLFNSCVNYVKTSRLAASHDIDWMVRNITKYGRVETIQNHWSSQGCKHNWNGAMVTYRTQKDCLKVIKRLFVDNFTSLTPVYIPDHLTLIGSLEERLLTAHPGQFNKGSTVVIIGDRRHRKCETTSTGIKKMAEQYGHVLSIVCLVEDSCCIKWEVTYRFAVEAVAALLALDGKFYEKGRLKTEPKWGDKEKRLNEMITGYY